jgi:hypothetical protein
MKLRYSRLWNLGNYENEKLEIERDYPDDMPTLEAYKALREELTRTREEYIAEEKAEAKEAARQRDIAYREKRIAELERDLEQERIWLDKAKSGE